MTSTRERYPCGDLQVRAELKPKSHDGPVVSGDVEDHGDGTYTITVTPQTTGPHQLHITMCKIVNSRHRICLHSGSGIQTPRHTPSFFFTSTIGEAQSLLEVSIIPLCNFPLVPKVQRHHL